MCYPLVGPNLRIEEHGRIRELVHGRVALVNVAVVLALSPLPVRGQEVESVEGGHCPGRSLLVFGDVEIGRGLLTATALDVDALALGETGIDPRIDTGLARTTLGVTGRGLLTVTGHVVSVRVPLPTGEVRVTGHGISRVVLMTARGHAINNLPLLTARGLVRKDGWPDEISMRVVRRWQSPRLLLYLKRRLELLPLREGLLCLRFRLLYRILSGSF